MAVTFFGALFLELEFAIFAGVLLSLVLYLMRVSKPRIITRVPDPRTPGRKFVTDSSLSECPQLHIMRIDGSLFFGSINHVQEAFADLEEHHAGQKHLAIVADGINFADITGGAVLVAESRKRKARGGNLYLMKVKKGLWESLEKCGCLDAMGSKNVFQSKTAAITGIFQKLDKNICRHCDKRIFRECASVERADDNL
jgi:SulP family sulfate permease